jgi:hypothetical protein
MMLVRVCIVPLDVSCMCAGGVYTLYPLESGVLKVLL